jgi:hypothetical protein
MSLFEFILMMVAIVLGLGIAELFGGVVRMLRGEFKAGRLHSLWVGWVFLIQVQFAWATWGLPAREVWFFYQFALLLAYPIVVYVAAALLFPSPGSAKDLEDHLLDRRRPFFGTLICLQVVASFMGIFVFSSTAFPAMRVALVLGFLVLAVTRNHVVHWVLGISFLVQVVAFIARVTPSLSTVPG